MLSVLDSVLTDEGLEELVEIMQVAPAQTYLTPTPADDPLDAEQVEAAERLFRDHVTRIATGDLTALLSELKANRRNWAERFGLGALSSQRAVDQREVDYRRGFYSGARYYLELLPNQARHRLRQGVEDA